MKVENHVKNDVGIVEISLDRLAPPWMTPREMETFKQRHDRKIAAIEAKHNVEIEIGLGYLSARRMVYNSDAEVAHPVEACGIVFATNRVFLGEDSDYIAAAQKLFRLVTGYNLGSMCRAYLEKSKPDSPERI